MTRFGHKLNYVINTFVKHTPDQNKNSYGEENIVSRFNIVFRYQQIKCGNRSGPQSPHIFVTKTFVFKRFVKLRKNWSQLPESIIVSISSYSRRTQMISLATSRE